jgi:hypothetical protein
MKTSSQKFAAFGQVIESDFDLSPCAVLKAGKATVRIQSAKLKISGKSFHRLRFENKKTYALYFQSKTHFSVRFPGLGSFQISKNGKKVRANLFSKLSAQETAILITHHVLPLCFSLQKILVVHAAAVLVKNKARLICAPAGTGKSTLCAHLYAHGYQILSDDACAITRQGDQFKTSVSTPLIRRWNANNASKTWLQFQVSKPLQTYTIHSIFFPQRPTRKQRLSEKLQALSALDSSPLLLAQIFRISFESKALKQEFHLAMDLCQKTPCFQIPYNHSKKSLTDFAQEFLK